MRQTITKEARFPDLTRAPFRLSVGASPARVARELVDCFEAVAVLRRPTRQVFAAAGAAIGLDPRGPHGRAGRAVTAEMDSGAGPGNAYHNRQHTCEVMLCTLLLARQQHLGPAEQARVLFAALIHDFRHDGGTNGRAAFRLEQGAIAAARPFMVKAGMDALEIERIAALVLATDLGTGAPFARRCLVHHDRPGHRPRLTPSGAAPEPLARLATDPALALQAVLVSEADLLPSVGLTPAYARRCQGRLAQENRLVVPGAAATRAFLNTHVPRLLVARFFAPNLEHQRLLVSPDPPTPMPAADNDPDAEDHCYALAWAG